MSEKIDTIKLTENQRLVALGALVSFKNSDACWQSLTESEIQSLKEVIVKLIDAGR